MNRRLLLTLFLFQLCLMHCWADEFESILKTSAEVYARERIFHKTQLAWKADDNQWIELPTNIMPLVERGVTALEILEIQENDDKFMREVKWLTPSNPFSMMAVATSTSRSLAGRRPPWTADPCG